MDHVHILLSIPPKYSVSKIVGYLKGKSALEIVRRFGKIRKIMGEKFWAKESFEPFGRAFIIAVYGAKDVDQVTRGVARVAMSRITFRVIPKCASRRLFRMKWTGGCEAVPWCRGLDFEKKFLSDPLTL